eukprot:1158940-Pelagomonas_calceolata.AAC.9
MESGGGQGVIYMFDVTCERGWNQCLSVLRVKDCLHPYMWEVLSLGSLSGAQFWGRVPVL